MEEGHRGGRRGLEKHYPEDNPIITIVKSGATGNLTQTRTLAGMKGLVTNPKGEFIPRPIKSSFREGLTVLEYFINTHGARKDWRTPLFVPPTRAT